MFGVEPSQHRGSTSVIGRAHRTMQIKYISNNSVHIAANDHNPFRLIFVKKHLNKHQEGARKTRAVYHNTGEALLLLDQLIEQCKCNIFQHYSVQTAANARHPFRLILVQKISTSTKRVQGQRRPSLFSERSRRHLLLSRLFTGSALVPRGETKPVPGTH